jgi:8-oxo-dGTP diphosphatase
VNLLPTLHHNQEHSMLRLAMPRVLLTGFTPFGDHVENISEKLVNSMPTVLPIKNPFGPGGSEISVEKKILSVDVAGSTWTSEELESREWDAILHLGLCGECTNPRIELRAQDSLDMKIPDNSGRQIINTEISGRGHLKTPVQVKRWDISSWNISPELSNDAGNYLCNETYYRTLDALQASEVDVPCLFLHLPDSSHLSTSDGIQMIRDVISHMLYRPSIQVAAGVFHSKTQFLAMQRSDSEPGSGKWEFPGGGVESNESPEEAVIRELKEELGVTSEINKKLGLWSFTYPFLHVELHVFLVSTEDSLDSLTLSVHKSMQWVNSEDASRLDWLEADLPIVEHLQSLGY